MRIGVIRYFPGEKVAENENVLRIKESLELLGHSFHEIDFFGKGPDGEPIGTDLIFNLHFQYPKATLTPQISFLWNPTEFYYSWGFRNSILNELSRDFFVSSGSSDLVQLIENNRPTKNVILGQVNHSIAAPWFEPVERYDRKLFYVGINWERATGKPGRYERLLSKLSQDGVLDIYGPRKIQGVKPWDKRYNYRGEIDFDGHSLVNRLHQTGCALVLSSKAHIKSGILTNRFFEGLKAGVPIVIGESAIPEWLRKLEAPFWVYDDSANETQQAEQIESILKDINHNPTDTYLRIQLTQRKLSQFELTDQIKKLIEVYEENLSKPTCFENILVLFALDFDISRNYVLENLDLFQAADIVVTSNLIKEEDSFFAESGITARFVRLIDFDISICKKEALGIILCGQESFDSMISQEVSDFMKHKKLGCEILVLAATEIGPFPHLSLPLSFAEYAPSQFVFPLRLLDFDEQRNLNLELLIEALENGAYQISPRVGQLLTYNFTSFAKLMEASSSIERVSEFKVVEQFLSPEINSLENRASWRKLDAQSLSVLDLLVSEMKLWVLTSISAPIKKKLIFKAWKLLKRFVKKN